MKGLCTLYYQVGRRLRFFLERKKIPPRQLSSELQIPLEAVENHLKGAIDNDSFWLVLYYLVMLYGLDFDWLLHGEGKFPGSPGEDWRLDG